MVERAVTDLIRAQAMGAVQGLANIARPINPTLN
jgi:hypothetical protein